MRALHQSWSVLVLACISFVSSFASERIPLFRQTSERPLTTAKIPASARFTAVNPVVFDSATSRMTGSFIIPDVPMPGRGTVELACSMMQVLTDDAVVAAGTRHGDEWRELDRHLMVKGHIVGEPGSFVYLAFFRTYVMGYIERQEAGIVRRILFAPDDAEAKEPVMVIYDQADVANPKHPGCEAENMPDYIIKSQEAMGMFAATNTNDKLTKLQNAQTLLARVAVDCDTKYYNQAGSNFSRAANYMLVAMGAVSAVYQRDVNVAIQVPYLRIWTENCPYTGDLGSYLNQGRNYWNANMGSVSRTTTYIVTSYTGGLAWVGVLCGSYAYSAGGVAGNANFPVNQYVWDVDVLSHELGHNFGSPHTHNCGWNPPVDSCVSAEGGCYAAPIPRKGTIMSYCHLTSYGTELRFHPRVATLLRASAVRALSSCMRNLASTRPLDVQASAIIAPANGSMQKANTPFAVRGMITNVGSQRAQDFTVSMQIIPTGSTTPMYASTRNVSALDVSTSRTIDFDSARVLAGTYTVTLRATMTGDADTANNILTRTIQVTTPPTSTVDLLYPNGGEKFMSDSTVTVRWTSSGASTLLIEFSSNNGISWVPVRTFQNAADGNTQWKVPAVTTREGRIRITDMQNGDVWDQSSTAFSIDCDLDVQFVEFVTPASDTTISAPFVPAVRIRSNGIQSTAFKINLMMQWRASGDTVYNRTITIPSIDAYKEIVVNLPDVTLLPPGQIVMTGRVVVAGGDRNPSNDSLGRTFNHNGGISPPTGIRAQAVAGAVLLWWGASLTPDITSYEVSRSIRGGTTADVITSLPPGMLSYVDDNVVNGTDYTYWVRAVRQNVRSVWTRGADAKPDKLVFYDSLQSVRALIPEAGAKSVPSPTRFVWSRPDNALWYQIQIAQGTSMNNVIQNYIVDDGTPIRYALTFKQNYCWRVRAFNFNNMTPWSAVNQFTMGTSCAGNGLAFTQASDRLSAPGFEWKNGGPVTVEFWNYVSSTDLSQQNVTVQGGTGDAANRFLMHAPFKDGNLYWDYGNINTSGRIYVDYKPYLDKWTHVAVVSDDSSYKAIYLDGKLVASSNTADGPKNISGLVLGISHFGKIDDFRIWSVVRSQADIESSMTKQLDPGTKGLALYYKLNEILADTIVADIGYLAAPGYVSRKAARAASDAPINCPSTASLQAVQLLTPADGAVSDFPHPQLTWTKLSGATAYEVQVAAVEDFSRLEFASSNAFESMQAIPGLAPKKRYYWRVRASTSQLVGPWSAVRSFTTDSACGSPAPYFDGNTTASVNEFVLPQTGVTIEWWQKLDATDPSQYRATSAFTIGTKDDVANRCQAHVPWNDGRIYWDFGNINNGGRLVGLYANGTSPIDNQWVHVALVNDGISFKAIYLNGKEIASENRAVPIAPLNTLRWAQRAGGGDMAKGCLREFRIWNRVRTPEEILHTMNTRIDDHPNLLGAWHFDEGSGSVAREARTTDSSKTSAVFSTVPQWQAGGAPIRSTLPGIMGPDTVREGDTVRYSCNTPYAGTFSWITPAGAVISTDNPWTVSIRWSALDSVSVIALRYVNPSGCVSVVEKRIQVMRLTSVSDDDTEAMFSAWPNPATDIISIRTRSGMKCEYRLRNMLGQNILSVDADAGNALGTSMMDVRGVPAGAYVLHCVSGNTVSDLPIIIVR